MLLRLLGLSSWLFAGSAAFDVLPTSLLSVATSVKRSNFPIDEEGVRAEDVFCSYQESIASVAAPITEELFAIAFKETSSRSKKENRDRLARLFKNQDVPSFHAGKCAVVSSSGVLLKHKYGSEIDASDLIFRFNDAEVTDEFAEAAGLKDDVRVMNTDAVYHLLNSAQRLRYTHSQDTVYAPQTMGFKATSAYQRWKATPHVHHDLHVAVGSFELPGLSQELLHKAYGDPPERYKEKEERHVTTGFLGMLLAMTMCDEVHAYGFIDSLSSQHAAYHYYGWMADGTRTNATDKNHHPTYDQERHFWRVVARNHDGDETDISVVPGFKSLQCHDLPP
mmetsp:Transcript_30355/g.69853  ORF Transcript_30355/g.69853 Transcript_30355/m.69853 type:complete len:336 (+) Transcript_30355:118-1125(+)